MSMFLRRITLAPSGWYFTPRSASGNERDDDQRVEDDRAEDRALRRVQEHDVVGLQRAEAALLRRVEQAEHRRQNREILRDVVRDAEGRQRAAGHEQLFADLDDLDQLRRVAVEVDHVAGLARGLRAGVHGDAHVGLRERRRVVGAVADHRDQLAALLLLADARELVLGLGLGDEVVHARLGGDGGGGERIVAGDHHGADAHRAELLEPLLDAALDDVLEQDDAEDALVLGHDERRAAGARDLLHLGRDLGGIGAALRR